MSGDRDFARFDTLPGFELVDYKRVGLPVFQAQIDVLTEERRELHLVSEYCLRLLQAGVSRLDDLIHLVGVSPQIVRVELADLLRCDAVVEREEALSITDYGNLMLEPYGDMVCAEATWYVPFDGILRRPYAWRADQLRTTRQLAELGPHLEISPIGDRPALREFEINAVSLVLSQLRLGGKDVDRLVSIRNVRKSPLRFVSAVALAYESKSAADEQMRIVFLIDGRPAPAHDEAFANSNGLRRPMFRALGTRSDSWTQIRGNTRRRLVRSRTQTSAPTELVGTLSLPGSEEAVTDIRELPIYEARGIWIEALSSAEANLVITTRAVSPAYLQELIPNLTNRLEHGVRVYLGIEAEAIQINKDGKPLDLPITVLTELQKRFERLEVQLIDQIIATHLIVDKRMLLVGDYDWLVPDGSSARQFRRSWVFKTENLTVLEKEMTKVLNEFKTGGAK